MDCLEEIIIINARKARETVDKNCFACREQGFLFSLQNYYADLEKNPEGAKERREHIGDFRKYLTSPHLEDIAINKDKIDATGEHYADAEKSARFMRDIYGPLGIGCLLGAYFTGNLFMLVPGCIFTITSGAMAFALKYGKIFFDEEIQEFKNEIKDAQAEIDRIESANDIEFEEVLKKSKEDISKYLRT